jgi:acetyl esterase/lipase
MNFEVRLMRRTLTAILFAALFCMPAFGKTWNGSASGLWSNPSNWSPAAVPVSGEALLFPPTGRLAMTNDLPAGFTVGTMRFENNYVLGGNQLTLAGDLEFASGVRFQSTADLRLGASVRFHAAASAIYAGALDVNGQTLTIDTISAGFDLDYRSATVRGPISGSGTIDVLGQGLSIASSGSFSGAIHGTIDIVGSYPDAAVTGTFISGNGSLGAVSAQSLSPGTTHPGHANASGVLGTLQTGPLAISWRYRIDLTPTGAADRVNVAGTVSLGGSVLEAYTPYGFLADGQAFTIIDNDGSDPVSGTFSGLAEGSTFRAGPWSSTLRISYRGGDGNDVVLTMGGNRSTTTTISQNRTTTEQHQPVTFTATTTAQGQVPTGTVSFFNGSENIGTVPLENGVAELRIKTLEVGAHNISAMYSGAEGFGASTSAVIIHHVIKGRPQVSLASSAPASVYGDPVTLTIAVAGIFGSPRTPTGSVSVEIGGSIADIKTLSPDGTATLTVPVIPAGVHTVTASYAGDEAFHPDHASITHMVTKAPTTVALASLANPSPVGVPVTVAIQVSPTANRAMAVGGNVVVATGDQTISEAQLIASTAAVRVGPLTGGEYVITATYAGNENFQPGSAQLTQRVAEPGLIVRTASLAEGSDAYDELVRVELTAASALPVTVDYQTVDETATANVDYVESFGTLVFNPGQTVATIPIRILGDAAIESDETFTIRLTNPAGAALVDDRVTLVIANDDVSYRAPVPYTIATEHGSPVQATFYAPAVTSADAGPRPVILWIPGDTAYDGTGGDIAALRATARGYAVLSVAYRATSKAAFPAQLLDLMAAVRWLRANAVTLDVDSRRIVAWGIGTGAHLATLLGTGYDGTSDSASRVHAVIAWGGISDLSTLQTDAYRCSTMSWNAPSSPASQLIGCSPQQCPAMAEATAPARYANAGDAPMLLMHGSTDCFVGPRQSERLHDALKRAGVDVTLRIIDFTGHNDSCWTSAAAFTEVDAFLDAKLKEGSGRRRGARH